MEFSKAVKEFDQILKQRELQEVFKKGKILLAFGKTGAGKSTLLNFLFNVDPEEAKENEIIFKVSASKDSVTSTISAHEGNFLNKAGKSIILVDMPGLSDTKQTNSESKTTIKGTQISVGATDAVFMTKLEEKFINNFDRNYHVVLFTIKLTDRIGQEERYFLDLLKIFFHADRIIPCYTFGQGLRTNSRAQRVQEFDAFFKEQNTMNSVQIPDRIIESDLQPIWDQVRDLQTKQMTPFTSLQEKVQKVVLEKIKALKPKEDENGGCFPGDALVSLDGINYFRMVDLKIGDNIISFKENNQDIGLLNSKTICFLDKNPQVMAKYLKIKVKSNELQTSLSLSQGHLIYAQKKNMSPAYVRAQELTEGDQLIQQNGNWVSIENIEEVIEKGQYAPLTNQGTLIVNGFCVSCYANTPSHTIAHWALAPLRIKAMIKKETEQEGVHPYAKFLMNMTKGFAYVE